MGAILCDSHEAEPKTITKVLEVPDCRDLNSIHKLSESSTVEIFDVHFH